MKSFTVYIFFPLEKKGKTVKKFSYALDKMESGPVRLKMYTALPEEWSHTH